jgi:hypothetical protein
MLTNLLDLLDKAQAHAEARGFSPDAFLALRLAPDMFPFTRQVQIACDMAKGAMSRLAGEDPPPWADTEATMEELRARIRRTLDHVQGFAPARIDGQEARPIVITLRSGERRFDGQGYLLHWALPNFYFHVTAAYALLRQAGVPVGKGDFLGPVG